ncbi:MAG TPA: c-type cytochrome biogenesis protein CcsB, partial [Ottowia sp.]|nr:c-type cytochrome biogenesis protein CcsB [Ottowia sp.]
MSVATVNPTTVTLGGGYFARRTWGDWLFALLVVAGAVFAFQRYHASMDIYEKWILAGTAPVLIGLGWFWRPLRTLMLVVAGLSLLAVVSYGGDLRRADSVFWLKYFLSSQSAILWMSM